MVEYFDKKYKKIKRLFIIRRIKKRQLLAISEMRQMDDIRRGIVVELARKRKDFIVLSSGKLFQIAVHLLRILYCKHYNPTCSYLKHWELEVSEWVSSVATILIKDTNKSNQYKVKLKALQDELKTTYELDNFNKVNEIWKNVAREKIMGDIKLSNEMFQDYMITMDGLIKLMAKSNTDNIKIYIENIVSGGEKS
jgi:hypothetical protein